MIPAWWFENSRALIVLLINSLFLLPDFCPVCIGAVFLCGSCDFMSWDCQWCLIRAIDGSQASSFFLDFLWRVRFWLRTNAGGVLNTCKSNEAAMLSGGLVSNVWATYPYQGNNMKKFVLIPHKTTRGHPHGVKDLSDTDGLISY